MICERDGRGGGGRALVPLILYFDVTNDFF